MSATPSPLDVLLRQTCPWRWPPPWDFLPLSDDVRAAPIPDDGWQRLRQEFSEDALTEAGIWRRRGDRAGPHPGLLRSGPLLALRANPQEPYDLLTERGLLSGAAHAAVAGRDQSFVQIAQGLGTLILAHRVSEVALLRSLGLPVLLAAGWTRPQVWAALHPLTANSPVEGRPLLLLGWAPLTLAPVLPPPLPPAVRQYLEQQELGSYLAVRPPRVALWQLPERQLLRLATLRRLRQPEGLRDFLIDRLDNFTELGQLGDAPAAGRRPRSALISAANRLSRALLHEPGLARHYHEHPLFRRYAREVDRALIAPLQQEAEASRDPMIRSLRHQHAEIVRALHYQTPLLTAGLQASPDAVGPERLGDQYRLLARRQTELVRLIQQMEEGA